MLSHRGKWYAKLILLGLDFKLAEEELEHWNDNFGTSANFSIITNEIFSQWMDPTIYLEAFPSVQ